jgi:hypothetical protein
MSSPGNVNLDPIGTGIYSMSKKIEQFRNRFNNYESINGYRDFFTELNNVELFLKDLQVAETALDNAYNTLCEINESLTLAE